MRTLIFDTETTALISNTLQPLAKQPRIIEFFGLVIDEEDDYREVETISQLINPQMPISEEVTRITGIRSADVASAPTFGDVSEKIADLISSVRIVVAHNLSYDMQVVEFEMARVNEAAFWPKRRICTVEATEHLRGHRLKLVDLHTELFGEGFASAHRAENDVRALARCYIELCKRGEI